MSLKDNRPLPFKFYTEVSDIALVQARLCAQKSMALKSASTWH